MKTLQLNMSLEVWTTMRPGMAFSNIGTAERKGKRWDHIQGRSLTTVAFHDVRAILICDSDVILHLYGTVTRRAVNCS